MISRTNRCQPGAVIVLDALVPMCLLANLSAGAVTFYGSVSPDPPGDGDVEATLIVGLEGDDDTDGADFLVWQRQSGQGSGTGLVAATQAVPEPSSLCSFLLAVTTPLLLRAKPNRRTVW